MYLILTENFHIITSFSHHMHWSLYRHTLGCNPVRFAEVSMWFLRPLFRLDHGRLNMREEFALQLRRTLKPTNDSSLDSGIPYETLAQLKTVIL